MSSQHLHGPRSSQRFRFHDLARHRIHDILLVSSAYDSFILSEDGQLDERILTKSLDLRIRHTPGVTQVATGREALALAGSERRHNLIITSLHVGDMNAVTLAREVKAAGLEVPVVLLGYDQRELADFAARAPVSDLERVFLWQGDVRLLLAIVKLVEDRLNAPHDTGEMGVQAIILIEDSVRYYSSYLPVLYARLMHQTWQLVPEGLNASHQLLRIQARPKILLCTSFEDAWAAFEAYEENVLGVISDVEFPWHGRLSAEAGFEFARRVRARQPDVPVMLQSSHERYEARARREGGSFLLKGSPVLLNELDRFMTEHFGFGEFVFRMPDEGGEIARASDLPSLEALLATVPPESVAYHASRNHFSKWLKARTEFALAHRLRPRKVSDFATVEDLRHDLVTSIRSYREERARVTIADFRRDEFEPAATFTRIGAGSIGGKARGLAFVNALLAESGFEAGFPGVRVRVPQATVLAADAFDRFLDRNDLRDFAIRSDDEAEILRRFDEGSFDEDTLEDLRVFLGRARDPLAVRSSSLLEDSLYQPFAGIYETYLLPNNAPIEDERLAELTGAIRRVYASTFSRHAKAYHEATSYRLEEEKMAVILQRVAGLARGSRFYPDFAGVARSHNFYPLAPMTGDDGIAAVALGLGATVVAGEPCVRFCPRYPRHLVDFSSVRDTVRNTQRQFYAIPLEGSRRAASREVYGLEACGLDVAEADGTLAAVGSTYSNENDAVYDGIARPGVRLVTLAPILKQALFPLPEILDGLLAMSAEGTSGPVEIEFAATLHDDGPHEFSVLQLRPLSLAGEMSELEDVEAVDAARVICRSTRVLGHGKVEGLRDLVVVDYHRFERGRSQDVALEVSRFNAELAAEQVPYGLIGVGRWGSRDPLLGIPVTWDQISGARVIVEAGFRDMKVAPSQGTHFFQNLVARRVGYFTVNPEAGDGFVDWNYLEAHPAERQGDFVRHLRFDRPIAAFMNGRTNSGVIVKP